MYFIAFYITIVIVIIIIILLLLGKNVIRVASIPQTSSSHSIQHTMWV